MNTTKLNKSDYIFLLIVFIGFYLLYRFSIFTSDDYYYSFIAGMSGGINGEYVPVESISDAIKSNIYDYMHWNGRFIIHTLTSYFCGVVGVDIFRALNSIMFVLFIAGLIKLIRFEFGYNKTDRCLILFFFFLFIPQPGFVLLGHISYVINYLWTACVITYFILLYSKIKDGKNFNSGVKILLFITGTIIGSLQESFTIGISGALFIYYCFNFKKFRGSVVWLIIGFWLGTCLVTFAPGNFVRLGIESNGNTIIKYVSNLVHLLFFSRMFVLNIILLTIFYFKDKIFIKTFIKKNLIFYLSIIFNGIIVIITYTGPRQLFSIELFSIILLIKLLYSYKYEFINNNGKVLNIIIGGILILLYIPIHNDRYINHYRYINLQNKEPLNGIIVDKEYVIKAKEIKDRFFIYKYIMYFADDDQFNIKGLSLLKSNGKNSKLITAILPITPNEIDSKFKDASKQFIYDEENKTYYFRAPKGKEIESFKVIGDYNNPLLNIRNKLFNHKIDITFMIDSFHYSNYNYYSYIDRGIIIHDFEIEYKEK